MRYVKGIILIVAMLSFVTLASAQCSFKNSAFKSGETLSYNLYFNWKFVWLKVGTAGLTTTQTQYKGKPAYKASLTTSTSKKVDKMFVMRDTLLVYSTLDLAPLYYRKGAHEGKRYTVDEVWYDYAGGKCNISQSRKYRDGTQERRSYSSEDCVYDMLNIFLRARNFNSGNWKKGHTINFTIADGNGVSPAKLKYVGKKNVKADNDVKYRCLELVYTEKEGNGKWREIARFFVTDDDNHVPVRLDMSLKFGSAKAFMTNMKGLRNEVKSKVK